MGPPLYPINADKVENIDNDILQRRSDHMAFNIEKN